MNTGDVEAMHRIRALMVAGALLLTPALTVVTPAAAAPNTASQAAVTVARSTPAVSLAITPTRPKAGERLTISGVVSVKGVRQANLTVRLSLYTSGKWSQVASARTDSRGVYRFARTAVNGSQLYRTDVPATAKLNARASAGVRITASLWTAVLRTELGNKTAGPNEVFTIRTRVLKSSGAAASGSAQLYSAATAAGPFQASTTARLSTSGLATFSTRAPMSGSRVLKVRYLGSSTTAAGWGAPFTYRVEPWSIRLTAVVTNPSVVIGSAQSTAIAGALSTAQGVVTSGQVYLDTRSSTTAPFTVASTSTVSDAGGYRVTIPGVAGGVQWRIRWAATATTKASNVAGTRPVTPSVAITSAKKETAGFTVRGAASKQYAGTTVSVQSLRGSTWSTDVTSGQVAADGTWSITATPRTDRYRIAIGGKSSLMVGGVSATRTYAPTPAGCDAWPCEDKALGQQIFVAQNKARADHVDECYGYNGAKLACKQVTFVDSAMAKEAVRWAAANPECFDCQSPGMLAYGYNSGPEIAQAWYESPGHRNTMLSGLASTASCYSFRLQNGAHISGCGYDFTDGG